MRDADQLAGFMELFNSKLAKEVIRLTGWKDRSGPGAMTRSQSARRRARRSAGWATSRTRRPRRASVGAGPESVLIVSRFAC